MSTGTSNLEGCKTRENIIVNRPNTRNKAKHTGVAVPLPSLGDDIRDATQGRFFLEERLLLCPTGKPTTNSSLIACLHQISNMKGATKLVASAVRAMAFLIGELEETAVNEIVRDAVITQLNELTADVKLLVNDVKEKIDDHMKSLPPHPTSTQLTTLIINPRMAHGCMQMCWSPSHHMQTQSWQQERRFA